MTNQYAVIVDNETFMCEPFHDVDKGSGIDIYYIEHNPRVHVGEMFGWEIPDDEDADEGQKFEQAVEDYIRENVVFPVEVVTSKLSWSVATTSPTQRIADLKAELESYGLYCGNLWRLEDVKSKFNCTDDQAYKVLDDALENDATTQQIWSAIDFHGENDGLERVVEVEE